MVKDIEGCRDVLGRCVSDKYSVSSNPAEKGFANDCCDSVG